jgi:hypothetical protein
MPYMNRGDSVAIVDATARNRWRWEWLQDTDTQKHTIGDWCEKIDRAGLAFCRICNVESKYGSNGRKSLMTHSNSPDHIKRIRPSMNMLLKTVPAEKQARISVIQIN